MTRAERWGCHKRKGGGITRLEWKQQDLSSRNLSWWLNFVPRCQSVLKTLSVVQGCRRYGGIHLPDFKSHMCGLSFPENQTSQAPSQVEREQAHSSTTIFDQSSSYTEWVGEEERVEVLLAPGLNKGPVLQPSLVEPPAATTASPMHPLKDLPLMVPVADQS